RHTRQTPESKSREAEEGLKAKNDIEPVRSYASARLFQRQWACSFCSSLCCLIRLAYRPSETSAVATALMRIQRHLLSASLTISPMTKGERIPAILIQCPAEPAPTEVWAC